MRITCPACDQSFSVPDGAITEKGRKLKCSKCEHKWHQMPVEDEPEPVAAAEAAGDDGEDAGDAQTAGADEDGGAPSASAVEQAGIADIIGDDLHAADGDDDDDLGFPRLPSSDDRDGPDRPPRRILLKATIALVLFIMVVGGSAVAMKDTMVSLWAPSALLFDKIGMHVPVPGEGMALQNVLSYARQEGQVQILVVQGELFNATDQMMTVPGIRGYVIDEQGAEIDSWLFAAEAQVLLPRETAPFESQFADPPAGAAGVTLVFSAERPEGGLGY